MLNLSKKQGKCHFTSSVPSTLRRFQAPTSVPSPHYHTEHSHHPLPVGSPLPPAHLLAPPMPLAHMLSETRRD